MGQSRNCDACSTCVGVFETFAWAALLDMGSFACKAGQEGQGRFRWLCIKRKRWEQWSQWLSGSGLRTSASCQEC